MMIRPVEGQKSGAATCQVAGEDFTNLPDWSFAPNLKLVIFKSKSKNRTIGYKTAESQLGKIIGSV